MVDAIEAVDETNSCLLYLRADTCLDIAFENESRTQVDTVRILPWSRTHRNLVSSEDEPLLGASLPARLTNDLH
jgi:hypothetical protein